MTAHITKPEDVIVHRTGYVAFQSLGVEITALPLMDRNHDRMLARLGHGAQIDGVRLPTVAELDALQKVSFHVEPYTLPDAELLRLHNVPHTEAAINDFRTKNMRSFEWCRRHDLEVWRRAEAAGWDGIKPIANFGKAWTVGGGIYGWWRQGRPMIQALSYFHKSEPSYTDYATKVHAVRPIGSKVGPPLQSGFFASVVETVVDSVRRFFMPDAIKSEEPVEQKTVAIQRPTIRLGSSGAHVQAWQGIIGVKPDGSFGPATEQATRLWQDLNGLVDDGIVGPKCWIAAGQVPMPPAARVVDLRSKACRAALRDANATWPTRSKRSDGILGDARHQASKSDHNSGNAVDITHDPLSGADGQIIAEHAIQDQRVTYVIWQGRIFNRARAAEGWRKYTGSNPHNHHVHISVRVDVRDDDSAWGWAS